MLLVTVFVSTRRRSSSSTGFLLFLTTLFWIIPIINRRRILSPSVTNYCNDHTHNEYQDRGGNDNYHHQAQPATRFLFITTGCRQTVLLVIPGTRGWLRCGLIGKYRDGHSRIQYSTLSKVQKLIGLA
jgi:hypothetical protein